MTMSASTAQRMVLLRGGPTGQLLIHELYRSIQGESTFAGLPCVFVRLSVCDARCRWCDTPHAFNQGERLPRAEVLRRALAVDCPLVEGTGGGARPPAGEGPPPGGAGGARETGPRANN